MCINFINWLYKLNPDNLKLSKYNYMSLSKVWYGQFKMGSTVNLFLQCTTLKAISYYIIVHTYYTYT